MYRPIAIVAISALILLAGQGRASADKDGQDAQEEGFATFTKNELPRGEVRRDKALIYVVRPTSIGFAIKSWFLCDDIALGVTRGSSYFFAHVDPGKHVFWPKSENVDALELEVEAGKTYYIQQHVRLGGLKARTKLEVTDDMEGERLLAKCDKHSALTEKGRERGAEIAREHREATTEDLERRAKKAEREGT